MVKDTKETNHFKIMPLIKRFEAELSWKRTVAALSLFLKKKKNYVNSVAALLVQLDPSPFSSINISLKKNKQNLKGTLQGSLKSSIMAYAGHKRQNSDFILQTLSSYGFTICRLWQRFEWKLLLSIYIKKKKNQYHIYWEHTSTSWSKLDLSKLILRSQ
jgi:hypothetical protein